MLEKSHENVRSFQQRNATIDPSILGVSCMQPQSNKSTLAFEKIANRFVWLTDFKDFCHLGWEKSHKQVELNPWTPMFEKEIPALEPMIFRFHSSNSVVITQTSRDHSPGGFANLELALVSLKYNILRLYQSNLQMNELEQTNVAFILKITDSLLEGMLMPRVDCLDLSPRPGGLGDFLAGSFLDHVMKGGVVPWMGPLGTDKLLVCTIVFSLFLTGMFVWERAQELVVTYSDGCQVAIIWLWFYLVFLAKKCWAILRGNFVCVS